MRPCETIIATIEVNGNTFDMELPAFMPISELKGKVVDTLRVLVPLQTGSLEKMHWEYKGRDISEEQCLAACGIWDGSSILYSF